VNNNWTYGKLYNWYTIADPRGLCPTGWHVPTEAEWIVLINYLGGVNAGGKMKTTTGWNSPNTAATNESGFSGLPGDGRSAAGDFGGLYSTGLWWSSSENSPSNAEYFGLYYMNGSVQYGYSSMLVGMSTRCIKN
jgi:uncharacterized protein (TIGR02145 family)